MFLNLYLYNLREFSPPKAYDLFLGLFSEFGYKPKYYDIVELLPSERANHPGDIQTKNIGKKELEQGIQRQEFTSFNISNKSMLTDPDIFVCYLNDARHGGTSTLSIHLPIGEDTDTLSIEMAFDRCVAQFNPEYGFTAQTRNASDGVKYVLSSFIYKKELINFSQYLRDSKKINKMRMVYSINYLSSSQLATNYLSKKIEEFCGEDGLIKISNDIWRWNVPKERLNEVNQTFGEEGFLVSWESKANR